MSLRQFTTALVLALSCTVGTAHAQSADEVAADLNRQAMEAYNNLDINTAGAMLEEALRVCEEGGVQGNVLALTNLNLGVVYIGGLGDKDGAMAYFNAAVCADSSVQLDPLVSTPDVQAAFSEAQGAASCEGAAAPSVAPGPAATAAAAPTQMLVHVPPGEQLSQTPLPLYAEVNGAASAVYLYYKGLGMEDYKRVQMTPFGSGVAYQITCNDVWEPAVGYYLEAVDGTGGVVGGVGSRDAPVEVPIVSARTLPAPMLPGGASPSSCAVGECPPGMTCPTPGTAGTGEPCDDTSQCQSGLTCSDDMCILKSIGAPSGGGGGGGGGDISGWEGNDFYEDPDDKAGDSDFRRFFFQIGFTAGLPYVQAGLEADSPAPANRVFILPNVGYVENPEGNLGNILLATQDDVNMLPGSDLTAWVPDADSNDSAADTATGVPLPFGGSCPADGTVTGPQTYMMTGDLNDLYPSKYCVRVKTPGFVFQPALRANVGYFVTESFSLAGVWRFQLGAGEGSLASMLLGLRAEYMFSDPVATGFMSSGYLGFTVGQIQAQAPLAAGSGEAPWIISGMQGAHVGMSFRYRFAPNVGMIISPEADFQFPSFLMNIDITVGPELAF